MMVMLTESMTTEMQTCMNACMECHKICLETMTYCMIKGGKHVDMGIIGILRDCSEICMMCMNMMMGGSEFTSRTCMLCAEMCERCASACETISNDKKMSECAASCRKCAETCCNMTRVTA
ncbi:MAG: four-helix bundle copper-binding protein [Nostocales cyanobacterium]|nr:MAG: four-helix bundle copper-binding protein [Nostocales cyanobacterium]TAF20148.1 MAG: four-helix bundle copper-binding protein [Nostocales cyanobacterium]